MPARRRVRIRGFPPLEPPRARILVLGSMPGIASLRAQQYYAHPQNAFWRIFGAILDFDPHAEYALRKSALAAAGIALWDVLESCTRAGSLDADIDAASIAANDFAALFARQPRIRRICFNGAKAEQLYARHVLPRLGGHSGIERLRLPSTSPAHASLGYAQKLQAWRAACQPRGATRCAIELA